MLDAPEAAGGHSAFLGSVRNVLSHRCTVRIQAQASGGSKGTQEAREKVGHCAGHKDDDDGDGEEFRVPRRRQVDEFFMS